MTGFPESVRYHRKPHVRADDSCLHRSTWFRSAGPMAPARALKKMKSDVPIIVSTGQGEQPGLADFEALGVKNFLAKPYNTQQLLATIQDTLQEKA